MKNVRLIEVKHVTDHGDYHLIIADSAGRKMIVEFADADCVEKAFKRSGIATAAAKSTKHVACRPRPSSR